MKNYNDILNTYDENSRDYLTRTMAFLAIAGASCPIENAEDFAKWCAETLATREEYAAKQAAAKAKRAATEARKAAEAGLTVEQYRARKAAEGTAKRLANEIAELEKQLTWKRARLAQVKKTLAGA